MKTTLSLINIRNKKSISGRNILIIIQFEARNVNLTNYDSQAVVFIESINLAYILFQNTIMDNIRFVSDQPYLC